MSTIRLIRNPAMKKIIGRFKRMASNGVSILLEGETGTGKNFLAQQAHLLSDRSQGSFLPLICGALPDTLFESELFGYEKGAFTGAGNEKPGLVEMVRGGTLFLDEIENLSLSAQGKLLRVLDEKKFLRLGALEEIDVAFRLVCASNKSLKYLIESGAFRKDLYYRIAAVHLVIPPLRDRAEDILPLANHFLEQKSKTMGKRFTLSRAAEELLLRLPWPGNVRQLRDAIAIAVISAEDTLIRPADFSMALEHEDTSAGDESLAAAEKRHIANVLQTYQGNRTKAARALQITETTLRNKIKKYGL
ncbi:AAA domain-containing protein [candidate division KSB1 bacterium]|nr:AAA domain-containing protein [candidate division KSB1 bacterium]NIR69622.1 AAA domain-containing protein [candidate division KSB1 bacterium]NIS27467.1 AAA domain-containing protein [candidate division KSB1 bacterium]NIT74319.1 AAA domain-containing protein [candidate division KSB1 bacterium]NIU28181.1 AAA domain-containing protein [candidate division KSB1 bacterium]